MNLESSRTLDHSSRANKVKLMVRNADDTGLASIARIEVYVVVNEV